MTLNDWSHKFENNTKTSELWAISDRSELCMHFSKISMCFYSSIA